MPKAASIPEIRFNLKTKKDKNKASLILAVFRYPLNYNTIRLVYSTQLKIEPKNWNDNTQLPRSFYDDYEDYKESLVKISKTIRAVFISNRSISLPEFKQELDYRLERKARPENEKMIPSLLDFIDSYII